MTPKVESKSILDNPQVIKRVCLYARTSGDDGERDSLTAQTMVCETYANAHGYVVVERIEEDVRGVKGDDFNAPGLLKALTLAKAGLYDTLLIRDVARYGRDVDKALHFERLFFELNIPIEYVWNQALNNLPQRGPGRIMRFIEYWLAEEDRLKIIKTLYNGRVNNSVRNKKRVLTHGVPPYGYKSENFALIVIEEEAQWVRNIFHWYVIEELSLRAIARKLAEALVPTPSEAEHRRKVSDKKRGRYDWQISTIAGILKNPVYIGQWTYAKDKAHNVNRRNKSSIKDFINANANAMVTVPALIDRSLFDMAMSKLSDNAEHKRRPPMGEYLLRGHCTCGLCNYRTACDTRTHKAQKSRSYYACAWRKRADVVPTTGEKCTLPYYRQERVDSQVWDFLKEKLSNEKELKQGFEEWQADEGTEQQELALEVARQDKEEKDLRADLTKQTQAFIDLTGNPEAQTIIRQNIKRIEETLERVKTRRQEKTEKLQQAKERQTQIKTLLEFASSVSGGFAEAEHNFQKRREIIEILEVEVTLTVIDGKMKIIVEFCLSSEKGELLYNHTDMSVQKVTIRACLDY